MHKKYLSFFLVSSFVAVAVVAGCSSSKPRTSGRGELCQMTSDCADGLNCVPRATGDGICVNGVFNVAKTAKECAVIQCANPIDCCPTVPQGIDCASLDTQCKASGNPNSSQCTQQNMYCKCDGSRYSCEPGGTCKSICTSVTDCGGAASGFTCTAGKCVECEDDSKCAAKGGKVCSNGACVPPCVTDTDCGGFSRCAAGHCTSGGCASDRECIAATKNVTAKCGSDQKCFTACASDLECGNPEEYKFYSCISSQCVYVGCATDKECQLYLGSSSTTPPTSTKRQIVCRDPVPVTP